MPGMDVRAALTVVGDGPVGAVGRQLDETFGLPDGHHQREWAVGMKMVVDLPEGSTLEPGTVFHTFGYPEPEIFGFLYVHPGNASRPSASSCRRGSAAPMRTSYRYLQHSCMHPYLWRYLKGGRLRSWGAKSLQESGRRGEPFLCGDGYARIGEGSGSTNVLTGSGVDEAWTTGTQLAEAVLELLEGGQAVHAGRISKRTYVARRRASWVEQEGRDRRKGPRRIPSRRGHRPDRHGAGRLHRAASTRSPASRSSCRISHEYYRDRIPAGGAASASWRTAARAASAATTR